MNDILPMVLSSLSSLAIHTTTIITTQAPSVSRSQLRSQSRPATAPSLRTMAKRGRDGEVQSLPRPSSSSLPDIAHDGIASFLPDGDSKHEYSLRVSEASRALLGSYGGSSK